MLDGTDLDDAYAIFSPEPRQSAPQQQQQQQQAMAMKQASPQQRQPGTTVQSPQLMQAIESVMQPYIPVQIPIGPGHGGQSGQMQSQQPRVVYAAPPPSYFDILVNRRRDVMKLVAFSIVILFAISIHTVVDFGFKEYIVNNDFTFKQELGIKLVYPAAVLLVLWNLKAMTSTSR